MRRLLRIGALVAATGALLGAAWAADRAPDSAATEKRATKLKLKRSPYGRVLFAEGYAMYLFTRDSGSESKCRGRCAKAWPPLRARGRVEAGRGVKKRLLGTTRRAGGSKQITYDGHPLYGYVDDPRGEVLCHDVVEFGGTWLAIRKSGEPAP